MHLCIHVFLFVRVYVCMYVCMYVYMYVYVYVYVFYAHAKCKYMHMPVTLTGLIRSKSRHYTYTPPYTHTSCHKRAHKQTHLKRRNYYKRLFQTGQSGNWASQRLFKFRFHIWSHGIYIERVVFRLYVRFPIFAFAFFAYFFSLSHLFEE